MDLWALVVVGAHGAWDVLAAAVRDGVVLGRVVGGDFDAFVGGLGAVFGGGVGCCCWCCCCGGVAAGVVARFGVVGVGVGVVVGLLAWGVWCFAARA